jgi:transposase
MDTRHDLTDAQFARLEPHLPPQKPPTGKPNREHRLILNGILWRLTTGAPWRDLPERFGPWQTVYARFRRWQQAGVWPPCWRRPMPAASSTGPCTISTAP